MTACLDLVWIYLTSKATEGFCTPSTIHQSQDNDLHDLSHSTLLSVLGETLTTPFQTQLPCSGDQACKNLLKEQQELETLSMMLKKLISPPSTQMSGRR